MILYINNKVDVNYRSLINSSQWNESHSVVLTLCDPMDYTVHGILQARILEWVAFPFSRGSSQPRDQTQVSHIAGGFFTSWAPRCVIIKVLLVSQLASPALWEESLNVTAESILCPSPWHCGVAPGRSSFTTSKYLSLWLSVSSPYMMPFFFSCLENLNTCDSSFLMVRHTSFSRDIRVSFFSLKCPQVL